MASSSAAAAAAPAKSRKWGLKKGEPVSRNHFSSNIKRNNINYSRLVVRVLEGKNLLASDIETGKSDPVCFCWVGGVDETPNWDVTATNGRGPGGDHNLEHQLEQLHQGEDGFDDNIRETYTGGGGKQKLQQGQGQGGNSGLDDNIQRVFLSKCCKTTIDPIWNEDVLVPVNISDMNGLVNMNCIVSLKDEDEFDGVKTYDDLVRLKFR